MCEKHLWKSGMLSEDTGHRPASLLKMLAGNGLNIGWKRFKLFSYFSDGTILGPRGAKGCRQIQEIKENRFF